MYLTEKINGFVNLLVISFVVLFIAVDTNIFVSSLKIKKSFIWLFKRIVVLKSEKI